MDRASGARAGLGMSGDVSATRWCDRCEHPEHADELESLASKPLPQAAEGVRACFYAVPRCSSSTESIGQAPSDQFAITEWVMPDAGSCVVQTETPAS